MKMHKFVVYVFDFEERGVAQSRLQFECMDQHNTVFFIKSADIGEWQDDHPLNRRSSNEELFESYIQKN